jgi:hypothetical protein
MSIQTEELERVSGDYGCDCASPLAAPVPDLCECEMEAAGSVSLAVEIKECSLSTEAVLKYLGGWVEVVPVSGVCMAHGGYNPYSSE